MINATGVKASLLFPLPSSFSFFFFFLFRKHDLLMEFPRGGPIDISGIRMSAALKVKRHFTMHKEIRGAFTLENLAG